MPGANESIVVVKASSSYINVAQTYKAYCLQTWSVIWSLFMVLDAKTELWRLVELHLLWTICARSCGWDGISVLNWPKVTGIEKESAIDTVQLGTLEQVVPRLG